jgi:hypothetical protein
MKTSTLKKMAVMLCAFLLTGFFTASAVLTISSMKGTGLPMYPQHNGAAAGTAVAGITFDYKIVTISGKSWAWTNLHGAAGAVGGATWASQLRYYSSTYGKTENNLVNRVTGFTSTQTYGSTTSTIPVAPLKISFFQDPNGMIETDFIPYDITAINSPVSGDITVPSVSACTSSNITETTVDLNITGSDNSGDLFYYITFGTSVAEVSFLPTITITGLTASTAYTLNVTPVDFSGNMGTSFPVSFTTGGLVQITSGIAQGVKFVLKSTTTQLEFYYEPADPSKKFRDTSLKITPAGGTQLGEIKPTMSPDGSYAYAVTNDANIANKIISINCGYWFLPGLPDYSDWVVTNGTITSGPLSGTPIKHQMGGGISPTEAETTPPVLNSVTLTDAAPGYVKLNINGSDNSGTLYYTISGAKSTVNAFRTGDYYLTAIDPAHVYTLSVKPYDLSGNTAAAQTLTVKTMNARSNIKDSTTTNYNTLVLPVAPNGELVTIIKLSGNNLTLGCTTKSLLIPAGASRNKKFNHPTIVINGTSYPLTMSADSLTATTTFNGTIGTIPVTVGTVLGVQWSVYWGSAHPDGSQQGGHYFTPEGAGAFTYVVGDTGQTDITGPSTPAISTGVNPITWPACTDDLSGVKSYLVSEYGQAPVTIFDLGGTTFTYTKVNNLNGVTVKAIDFVGNASAVATDPGIGTSNQQIDLNSTVVYPNPATDRLYISGEVAEVAIYSLQGQLVHSVINKNTVDVSTFAKGLYLVKVTDKLGIQKSSKLEIR